MSPLRSTDNLRTAVEGLVDFDMAQPAADTQIPLHRCRPVALRRCVPLGFPAPVRAVGVYIVTGLRGHYN